VIASEQVASIAGTPSMSTAVRIVVSTGRQMSSIAVGSPQSLKSAPLRKAPGLRACTLPRSFSNRTHAPADRRHARRPQGGRALWRQDIVNQLVVGRFEGVHERYTVQLKSIL
jgi:hypothetical protein